MTIRNFSYWWPRIGIAIFGLIFIYAGIEVLTFSFTFSINPPATATPAINALAAIGGAIVILFLIAWSITTILFHSWHLCDITWKTIKDIVNEANWKIFPMQLH